MMSNEFSSLFGYRNLSNQNFPQYSMQDKAFYGPVPSNSQSAYAPAFPGFSISRLHQTDLLEIEEPRSNYSDTVSLRKTVLSFESHMGQIYDRNGRSIGTCTLISENLVLTTRHAIQDKNIPDLRVKFGYCKWKNTTRQLAETRLDYVVEDNPSYDYAIVKLKDPVGKHLKFNSLNTQDDPLSELALLHYPLGDTLKVSVHTFDQINFESRYIRAFHDSDYLSSGGIYVDSLGRITAMQLGSQIEGDRVNVCRYATTLKKIIENNPNSLLNAFALGEMSPYQSYCFSNYTYYLEPYPSDFILDEEGYESKKILTNLLRRYTDKNDKRNYDKNIKFTQTGVAFSADNLQYIATNYPHTFKKFQDTCLNISTLHKVSKQYSVIGYIESDHTIPHDVWKSTTNKKMRKFIKGGGTRPGENELPAITIPYHAHRDLLTTGSDTERKKFRLKLVDLCNKDRIDDALIACFQEYENHGIDLKKYKVSVINSLDEHKNLGVITSRQKAKVLKTLGLI